MPWNIPDSDQAARDAEALRLSDQLDPERPLKLSLAHNPPERKMKRLKQRRRAAQAAAAASGAVGLGHGRTSDGDGRRVSGTTQGHGQDTDDSHHQLPLPVLSGPSSSPNLNSGGKKGSGKSARIAGAGLRVHWARFKQRLGTSTLSDSLLDGGETMSETTGTGSFGVHAVARKRGATPGGRTRGILVGPASSEKGNGYEEDEEACEVDEVVVDNVLDERSVTQQSDIVGPNMPFPHAPGSYPGTDDTTAPTHGTSEGVWERYSVLVFLRWRLWPAVMSFFATRFFEDDTEMHYRREVWFNSKSLALWASIFFILNNVLASIFVARPLTLEDKVYYFGIAYLFSIPLPAFVAFNFPRERPAVYQCYLTICVWMWCYYQTGNMYWCGFYGQVTPNTCGTRDFVGTFYYATALPTIAIFGLRATRFSNFLGAVGFVLLNAVLVIPFHTGWTRNVLNFICFHAFLLYVHWKRETAERRLYSLRDQLKVQFRATQKAQVNERKAADSKRRLTSYVFHEVRVPLNTALLAVQNMAATGTLSQDQEIEWAALEGSLSMMSKVLNDVLDFNRMDSGRFATVDQPYSFHQAIRSMLVPIKLACDARGLALSVELDPSIDKVARAAVLTAQHPTADPLTLRTHLALAPDEEGVVVGDEMRLRQILTNLASNACKFTPEGGSVRVVTRLLHPEHGVGYYFPEDGERRIGEGEGEGEVGERGEEKRDGSEGQRGEGESGENADRDGGGEKSAWRAPRRETKHSRRSREKERDVEKGDPGFEMDNLKASSVNGLANDKDGLSFSRLGAHDAQDRARPPLDRIVCRIEVHDTGVGIKAKDLVDNRLFSPYVQTEIGKYQGGKGTGLGLALVRRIVKLTGGRLGVKSKLGEGSIFWVELPLGVGSRVVKDLAKPSAHRARLNYNDAEGLGSSTGSGSASRPHRSNSHGHKAYGLPGHPTFTGRDRAILFDGAPYYKFEIQRTTPASDLTAVEQPLGVPSLAAMVGTPVAPTPGPGASSVENGTNPLEGEARRRAGETGRATPAADSYQAPATALPVNASASPTAPPSPTVTRIGGPGSTDNATSPVSSTLLPTLSFSASDPSLVFDKGLKVLVVDDDPLTRNLMKRMLTRLGCVVETAENGRVALDKILAEPEYPTDPLAGPPTGTALAKRRSSPQSSPRPDDAGPSSWSGHQQPATPGAGSTSTPASSAPITPSTSPPKYDIVFLDNQMPVMSGLDFVSELRELGRNDFVVGVTGNALLSDQQEYLDAGVDSVLTKPVHERSLKAMLALADKRLKDPSSSTILHHPRHRDTMW